LRATYHDTISLAETTENYEFLAAKVRDATAELAAAKAVLMTVAQAADFQRSTALAEAGRRENQRMADAMAAGEKARVELRRVGQMQRGRAIEI